jgi:hypothetical protein
MSITYNIALSAAARARRAPCLVARERGVWVCLVLCVRVGFEVSVHVGRGLS